MDTFKYESIDIAKCFSFSKLISKVKGELLRKNPDISEQQFAELMEKSLSTFRLNDQTFTYEIQKNHLGGFRWYINCPICEAKSLKLYLPENLEGREQIYACKKCHHLKNTSALLGATTKYKKVVKPLRRLETLKAMIMRKNMTPEKAQVLIDEYEAIEKSLESSKEYRLWKFQQRLRP